MKDLEKQSGLDIKLDGDKLVYDKHVFEVDPKTRTYADAKDVYLEKSALNQDLYFMYRYFEDTGDAPVFEANKAEYDITVIKSGEIGPEPIKTVGHYHATVPGTEVTYPEVYEIIEGEITYLLQTAPDDKQAVEVVIIEAKAGDKVIVPPGYGHISINRGLSVAVSSNIQRSDLPASANYDTIKETNGAALYFTGDGWQENYNYKVHSLRHVTPKEKPEWGILKNKPLYTSFIENPGSFKWLNEPQNYDFSDVWTEK
jgi:glucose-6-phosphate isomerase